MRERNVCVDTTSSSSESELAPHHRGADDQRRAWLDELAEARCQLDEVDLLHQELGMEAGPHDRRPVQDVPMQGEPHKGYGDRRERRPAADQPRGHGPMPPARAPEPNNNNRRANEGANANADAPPLFRRAFQNLAAAAMLLRGCPKPATSEERHVRE
jgi:hypothetical protein